MSDLSSQRRDYTLGGLSEEGAAADPMELFERWYADAADLDEPNAMVVATVAPDGQPQARTVLLKSFDRRGLVFFTQLDSAKGVALAREPRCSALFLWLPLQRQVRAEGAVRLLERAEVEAYFGLRPRASRLGAWASIEAGGQSQPVADRAALDEAYTRVEDRFPDEVPTPERWGGYRLEVRSWEFWQGRTGRLHDRLRYDRADEGWQRRRLAP